MILLVILLILVLPFAVTGWLFAPWIPIKTTELARLKKLIKPKPTDTFYELGCGDGRVVDYIKKTFNCVSIGVELNPFLYLLCLHRRGKYIFGNLFKQDISNADYVYLFGLPRALNKRVKAKLTELKPKAKAICYGFGIDDWKPVTIDQQKGKLPIFIYDILPSRNLRAKKRAASHLYQ